MKISVKGDIKSALSTKSMAVGMIGETLTGKMILRAYNVFVSLDNPKDTWDSDYDISLKRIFPKGTKIEMEVE